ncbi:MAG: DUF2878 domain-containing protein [Gammaproteobacteria bacterium]|nr:DUF2878 domain-containing protein [Gammaproteobacteria bacterium]
MLKLINFVLFQVGWFACVLGAAWGIPWAGTGIAMAIVAVHLLLAGEPLAESKLLAIAAGIGLVFDSALATFGWVSYPSGVLLAGTAPHWILALWLLFATTLNVSLAWLKPKPLLCIVFGAFGGPLAYYGGARLGALTLVEPVSALTALAIGWAVITPFLAFLAGRHNGYLHLTDRAVLSEVNHV